MADSYYKPCKELELCNELIEKYWKTGQYEKCFEGHLALAEKGYPLAECQVGFFFLEGYGVERNPEKGFFGRSVRRNTATGMRSTIWRPCMRREPGWSRTWRRRYTGTDGRRFKSMPLQWKNAGNWKYATDFNKIPENLLRTVGRSPFPAFV